MVFGKLSIWLALLTALLSAYAYFRADLRNGAELRKWQNLARMAFYLQVALVSITSLYFLFLILTHHFEVSYIYRYSSRSLGAGLLISSFWAGQEGSFLLWAWMLVVMGLFVRRRLGKLENATMLYLNLISSGFLIILIKANPFALLPQTPVDGAGLNPLLQNFWMVIHPPVLFLGYAAAAIPFALSLAALQGNDYRNWVKLALPWTLLTSITLGAGIIIGGFWAYEVLGWGGYWGWDPVENSSLIAWLVIIALFHGQLITKKRGALQKTNLTLAILSFFLVLYATFLTRSGILADFSVHSFEDLGLSAYLILFMGSMLLVGFGLLFRRSDEVPYQALPPKGLNKETALLLTMVLFLASAIFTWLGTSSPLITALMGQASQVDADFYNKVNLPLGILMALILGMAPFVHWGSTKTPQFVNRLIFVTLAGLAMLAILFLAHMNRWQFVLFMIFATMALVANLHMLFTRLRHSAKKEGLAAPLSHLGVVLIFMGIILSAHYSQTKRVVLTQNEPRQVFNAFFNYTGDFQQADGKNGVVIQVRNENGIYELRPRIYMNNYMNNMMHEPAIRRGIVSDLYLSPLQVSKGNQHQGHEELTLGKGETKTWHNYDLQFTGFEMSSHGEGQAIQVFANIILQKGKEKIKLKPGIIVRGKKKETIPSVLEDQHLGKTEILLSGINADTRTIDLMFHNEKKMSGQTQRAQVLMEISIKRFMSVLWFGTILLTAGTILGGIRRFKEGKRV